MKRIGPALIALFILQGVFAQKPIECFIKTSLGDITIELYPDKAPVTVANFLKYVDANLYDSSSFFRAVRLDNQPNNAVKIEVIQGGNVDSLKQFPPIPIETTEKTGLRHLDGVISMARSAPNSATCNFFICINDQPSLDFGGKRSKIYTLTRRNILNPRLLSCLLSGSGNWNRITLTNDGRIYVSINGAPFKTCNLS
jgi:peptidyl-prolyl cis-trans isomerase A (cyclophilin A)